MIWLLRLLQCTWGLPQTLVGLVFFLVYRKSPHEKVGSVIGTKWPRNDGVSLGLFIFYPANSGSMRSHEFGHTVQSLILGPLYLLAVGIPSFTWCNHPACQRYRREKHVPYSALYCEKWADVLGRKFL